MKNKISVTHWCIAGACMATLLSFRAPATPAAAPAAQAPTLSVAPPPAGHYQLDKSHASLLLRVSHLGFSTYTTRFSRFDAELTFDPANLAASQVVTTIDTASLEMDGAPQACIDIVRGPQLLDTAKFPQITFRSDRVHVSSNSLEITGTLNLHGVTRPLVLTATFNGGFAGVPMDPHARVGFSAHGSFKRSDFGMGFGVPPPGTTFGVGDLIDVSIEAEFTGPPLNTPAAAPH